MSAGLVPLVLAALAAGDVTFATPAWIPAGLSSVSAIAVADFDGDGQLDLAAGDATGALAVFLQDPADRGRWIGRDVLPSGDDSLFFLAADLDGDRLDDLVVIGSTASFLRSRGDGTFEATPLLEESSWSRAAAADLDGDGVLELATANWYRGTITVYRHGRAGQLAFATDLTPCPSPVSIAPIDADADGVADLVVACVPRFDGTPALVLLTGRGNLAFDAATIWPSMSASVQVADFDGDAAPDLLVDCRVFLRNEGNGVFDPVAARPPTASVPAIADVDGDGRIDLVAAESVLRVFPGAGGFAFRSPIDGGLTGTGCPPVVRDLDGDGRPDAVAPDRALSGLSIFRGAAGPPPFDGGRGLVADGKSGGPAAAADLDGSGRPDAIIGTGDQATAFFDPGRPDAGGGRATIVFPGPIAALEAGDIDGDGIPDLAALHVAGNRAVAEILRRDGSVRSEISLGVAPTVPAALGLGPIGDHGGLDVAVVTALPYQVAVFVRDAGGAFGPPIRIRTIDAPNGIAVADLDGDGGSDLLVSGNTAVAVHFMVAGGFDEAVAIDDQRFIAARAADVDGDGVPDIVGAEVRSPAVRIYFGEGERRFAAPRVIEMPGKPSSLALGDLDGDGFLDIAVPVADLAGLAIVRNGPGGFGGPAATCTVGLPAAWLRLADFDGDGIPDALVSATGGSTIVFGRLAAAPPRFRRGDADGDGAADITDAIVLLGRLFLGGAPLPCREAADANDDGGIDISDPIAVLAALFLGAGPLPPPGPAACGPDPTPDALGCAAGCP